MVYNYPAFSEILLEGKIRMRSSLGLYVGVLVLVVLADSGGFAQMPEDVMEDVMEQVRQETRETIKQQVRQETREVIAEDIAIPVPATSLLSGIYSNGGDICEINITENLFGMSCFQPNEPGNDLTAQGSFQNNTVSFNFVKKSTMPANNALPAPCTGTGTGSGSFSGTGQPGTIFSGTISSGLSNGLVCDTDPLDGPNFSLIKQG